MENLENKNKSERALREEKVLSFWKENKIFEKSLEKEAPNGEFVFYDGPPFATGLPHYGSLLSSIIKDVVPRYKTMKGFRVRRRWGWDCHGLPIENMVEKELGLKNKKEIEEMGVAKFNKACRDSVLRFADEWKIFVDRIGRFVDYDHSYKTMDNSYIESVWWALKNINEKGLLYEGRKVLLYCPHCETPLAKAEIAMDHSYKEITEESVYIKFKIVNESNSYLLAWTTTPWTLPGNVALAVGEDIDYVKVNLNGELFILAESRLSILEGDYEVVERIRGKQLVGIEFEPLYEIEGVKNSSKRSHYVTSADFVTTEDGTGIVHTAVIYGEDDYALGLKLDLPMIPLLDASGHFNNQAPGFIQGQYFKKAEKAIKEDLEKRNLLFKRENHSHSYPHCHRCGTALLYNALSSWFINIQKKKERIIELNENINWFPEHLKHGRFLNNLENAPDWTISRNRYWASPLPIWKDSDGKVYIIGSLDEIKKHTKKSGNKYFIMRHGGTDANVTDTVSFKNESNDHLTKEGKSEVSKSIKAFKDAKIDIVVSSPFARTKETAEIVRSELGLSEDIVLDERLGEVNPGEFDGKNWNDYHSYVESRGLNWFNEKIPGGESLREVGQRMASNLYELELKYENKNILLVTHGGPAWLAYVASGLYRPENEDYKKADEHVFVSNFKRFDNAEIRELPFVPLPHNEQFEIDLHRPFIDEIKLVSEDGKSLKRIPEVIDGWVESGSMPFAEYHYPFENKEEFEKNFPGDFIAEYIAQTRTWFYYMHTMASLLFDSVSFKNVVTTGNILATDGSKMSKSKGNYTDPMINLNLFGADALRYYLMSSVVMQAEDTRFVDDEVRQTHNQVINTLWNSFKFYELYAETLHESRLHSDHVLDRWLSSKFNELARDVTESMDAYDMVRSTRPMRDFISDFSTWYVRRSRDRFKGSDDGDKLSALENSRYIFNKLSCLIAPVMPFIAEEIYQKTRMVGDPESVHLALWPDFGDVDKEILEKMDKTREITSLALEARSKVNIKVRQPLNELKIKNSELGEEFLELIKDELNVKKVTVDESLDTEVELDTNITKELEEEGRVRDFMRTIQDLRKEKGLKPEDKMTYDVPEEAKELFAKYSEEIRKITNIEFN